MSTEKNLKPTDPATEIIEQLKADMSRPMVDPFKVDAFYMKKERFGGGMPTEVVKITKDAALEVYSGGSMETHEETKIVNLSNFMNKGYVPATREEFDRACIKAVKEINAVNEIV